MKTRASVIAGVACSFALVWGCSATDVRLGVQPPDSVPSFVSPETGTELDASLDDLVSYCPSSRCPSDWTTCPSSAFRCDVNLLTDPFNCGECGNQCPGTARGNGEFQCVGGQCILGCFPKRGYLDCDGIPDNGCETASTTNDNCGGCGIQCLDPAKPCIELVQGPTCGCPGNKIPCPDPATGKLTCVDAEADDDNCGTCGNACDPAGDGTPPAANTRWGCLGGKCDQPKCEPTFLDCDKDRFNGCETNAFSTDNCGACGNACPSGLECKGDRLMMPMCACPGEQVYCSMAWIDLGDTRIDLAGTCTSLDSDPEHCGGCNHSCPSPGGAPAAFGVSTCIAGMCAAECKVGRADCNGNPADYCEVNTDSDPRNCGGCGVTCDGIAGQACVRGQCVVEPCPDVEYEGGTAR